MNAIDRKFRILGRYVAQAAADLLCTADWHMNPSSRRFRARFGELVAAHKWVFIVGCNNSGTSILQRILEGSGQVSAMRFEGQRYTRVLPRAWRRGHERVWMEYARDLADIGRTPAEAGPRLLHDWLRALGGPVREVIVEKTPANVLRMEWLQACFPQSHFIGLVRNGYAVAEGIRRKSHKPLERAAAHWDAANRALLENAGRVERYMEITYERLTGDPGRAAADIAEFVGIDPARMVSAMQGRFRLPTVQGDRSLGLRNLNADSLANLDRADRDVIRSRAGEMLDHFGYSAD